MAHTRKQLRSMSREELVDLYDKKSKKAGGGLSLLQDEIHYRDQQKVSNQMWWMTLMITVLTVANVVFVAYQVFG